MVEKNNNCSSEPFHPLCLSRMWKMRHSAQQLYAILCIWNPQSQDFICRIRIMVCTEEPFSHMVFGCGCSQCCFKRRIVVIVKVDSVGGSYGAMSFSWCLTKAIRNERFSLKSQVIVNLKTMAYLCSRQLFFLEFCFIDHSITWLSLFFTFEICVVNQVHWQHVCIQKDENLNVRI